MTPNEPYDEEELAELLAELPPAPEGWVRRAQALAPQPKQPVAEEVSETQRDR